MRKIKIIESSSLSDVEKKVNEFADSVAGNFVDVKISYIKSYSSVWVTSYIATILYEVR